MPISSGFDVWAKAEKGAAHKTVENARPAMKKFRRDAVTR
jgi:hypothetical protein